MGKETIPGHLNLQGPFATWKLAQEASKGYSSDIILARVLDATLKVHRGEAMHERDSVLFPQIHYSWPLLAGLMWIAAQNGGALNVLDFGGALGSTYRQNRRFLGTLPSLTWNIVEQENFVVAGRTHFQDEHLRFFNSVEECLEQQSPSVAVLSSVLQYLDEPCSLLPLLARHSIRHVIIDILPMGPAAQDTVFVQHVHPDVYPASYPMRIFGEQAFPRVYAGYDVLEYFDSTPSGTDDYRFCGMILKLSE